MFYLLNYIWICVSLYELQPITTIPKSICSLTTKSSLMLAPFFLTQSHFFFLNISLLPGTFLLYFYCHGPRMSHFSKKSQFLLLVLGIQKTRCRHKVYSLPLGSFLRSIHPHHLSTYLTTFILIMSILIQDLSQSCLFFTCR